MVVSRGYGESREDAAGNLCRAGDVMHIHANDFHMGSATRIFGSPLLGSFEPGGKLTILVQSLVMEPVNFRGSPRSAFLGALCCGLRNRVENRRSSTEFSNGAHGFPQGSATRSFGSLLLGSSESGGKSTIQYRV